MKQIFDWMRGAILDKAYKVYDGTIGVDIHDVGNIINEAEAKWESDCCVWKPSTKRNSSLIVSPHMELFQIGKEDLKDIPYCPYCGKPIKISEVE